MISLILYFIALLITILRNRSAGEVKITETAKSQNNCYYLQYL